MIPDHECCREEDTQLIQQSVVKCPRQAESANSTSGSRKKQHLLAVIECETEGKEVRLAAGESEFRQKSCCSDNRGER